MQDRNIWRPQCCNEFHSSVCVQPPWSQAEPEHVNPNVQAWGSETATCWKSANKLCSSRVQQYSLRIQAYTVCMKWLITAASHLSVWVFFPKNKTKYLNPHRISFFSFLNLTSAVISQNSTQERSSLEFLKCVNFSYCSKSATALPTQLHLSVICQAALAICLQSTARRYINFPRWGRCWIYTDKWQMSSEWECVQE